MRIVRGGSIVTEGGVVDGDVAVSGGVIAGIGHRLDGDLLLDASDCWVLPGAIDPHIHVSLEGYSTMEPILDDAVDASASGLMGGVTTLGVFVQRTPVKDIVGVMRGLASVRTLNCAELQIGIESTDCARISHRK